MMHWSLSPIVYTTDHGLIQAGGAAYFNILWGISFGAWFARMIKSKDLLIGIARKSVGLA